MYSYIGRVGCFVQHAFFAILYFLYWSLTDNRPFIRKQYALFIPAFVLGMVNLIFTFIIGQSKLVESMVVYVENYRSGIEPEHVRDRFTFLRGLIAGNLGGIIDIMLMQCLLIIIIARLFNYRNKQKSFFILSAKRSRAVLGGLIVFLLSMFIYSVGEYLYYIEDYIPFNILFMLQGGMFFYIGYHVYYLDKGPELRPVEVGHTKKQAVTPLLESLLTRFNKLVDEDRIYLNADLRIDEIAFQLQVDRSQMYDLIEWIAPSGFAGFINRKRVEHAQELKQANPQMTQEEIALQSGFRHKASFCNAFRKYMGQSFHDWQKQSGGIKN